MLQLHSGAVLVEGAAANTLGEQAEAEEKFSEELGPGRRPLGMLAGKTQVWETVGHVGRARRLRVPEVSSLVEGADR